jgi:hypothetical protein
LENALLILLSSANILRSFTVSFFYAATLSAAELPGQTVEAASLRMESGNVVSGEALAVIMAVDSKKYAVDYKSAVIAPTFQNVFALVASDCLNKYCKEIMMIPLYKAIEENRSGLASLHDGFIMNLQSTISNLGVILQHRF